MKWLVIIGIMITTVALAAAVAAVIGSWLPKTHTASREARLPASPDAVWRVITDVERYSAWREGVSRVDRLPDRAGKATWVEHGSNGRITLTVDRAEPPRVLVVRIADPDLPFGGTWTYEISPAAEGSLLKIKEQGEIYNPLFRFMARFLLGYERTLVSYLKSVENNFAGVARVS